MPPRRLAFVVNSHTGGELKAGNRDAARIFTILTDPSLGACSPDSPPPLHSCNGYAAFHTALLNVLEGWQGEDQLIFYFSGHGNVMNRQYCLQSGPSHTDNVPFANILNIIGLHGVIRAIFIIDACHSGAALAVKSGQRTINLTPEESIPQGIALLASSRGSERSHELPDGAGSVFTTLLCEGVENGLDNTPTEDNLIGVDDIVDYVRKKLEHPQYADFAQTPMYTVNRADRNIWLAKNRSVTKRTQMTWASGLPSDAAPVSSPVRNLDELRLAYETTIRAKHPCQGASISDLDWKLVELYVEQSKESVTFELSREDTLRHLGMFSPLSFVGEHALHNAAVLCFSTRPERHIPQARSVFVAGDPSGKAFERTDIRGPLSYQVRELVELVQRHLGTISMFEGGLRREEPDTPIDVIREVISNAIVHRDYGLSATVHVQVTQELIEVRSPGRFPNDISWDALISYGHGSFPVDAAIALYVTNLLAFEGIGRGFEVIRRHLAEHGRDSIRCTTINNPPTISIQIARRRVNESTALTPAQPSTLSSKAIAQVTLPARIAMSSAPQDTSYRRMLETHLSSLDRADLFQLTFEDGSEAEVRKQLNDAAIILLLVSADYFDSPACRNAMERAIERARLGEALVLAVLLRPCEQGRQRIAEIPFLPRNGTPVTLWPDRDSAWTDIAHSVAAFVNDGVTPRLGLQPTLALDLDRSVDVRVDQDRARLLAKLEDARVRRRRLAEAVVPTNEVDAEIVSLKRQLREGGQVSQGDILGGRYSLLRRLGRGGFATVWEAEDRDLERRVAVKVLHSDLAADRTRRERFFRGARVMSQINNDAIVRILSPTEMDGRFSYFVMELLPGGDLFTAVTEGRVVPDRAVPLILHVGEALVAAHARGFIHRDVKPGNILLGENGEPKLGDFDLVGGMETTGGTRTGAMGSFVYAAPEMLSRPQDADHRVDVFGLGMTALFCLYGKPLTAEVFFSPQSVLAELKSRAVAAVIEKAIARKPQNRFDTIRSFCEALSAAYELDRMERERSNNV